MRKQKSRKQNSRNYGRQDKHAPSVVLKPQGRIAKYGKRPIVAQVDLGYAEPMSFGGGIYRHPMINFRSPDSEGCTIGGIHVGMKFQSHIAGSSGCGSDNIRTRSHGFMRPDHSQWVGSYGGELHGEFRYHGHGSNMAQIIALVNRARKRQPRNHDGCQLVALLVGLRRCGVEIRVWSSWLDAQRSERRPTESAERCAA